MRAPSIVACVLGSSCFSSILLCCEEGVGKELGRDAFVPTLCSGAEVPGLAAPCSGLAPLSSGVMGDEPGGRWVSTSLWDLPRAAPWAVWPGECPDMGSVGPGQALPDEGAALKGSPQQFRVVA